MDLAEGGAMEGLVTLLARPLKARVCWARAEGAVDLRRAGGILGRWIRDDVDRGIRCCCTDVVKS